MFDSILAFGGTVAVIGAGLMAGVYFAFSAFIMRSFDQLGAANATEAMNAINDVILRSWFMALFFGSTLLFVVLSVTAWLDESLPHRWSLFAAGLIYLFGMFLCTALANVPLNNRLAQSTDREPGFWQRYYRDWTRWNHLRAACSLLALVLCLDFLTA